MASRFLLLSLVVGRRGILNHLMENIIIDFSGEGMLNGRTLSIVFDKAQGWHIDDRPTNHRGWWLG